MSYESPQGQNKSYYKRKRFKLKSLQRKVHIRTFSNFYSNSVRIKLSIVSALIFSAVSCASTSTIQPKRDQISTLLLKLNNVTEASAFPWIKYRNLPFRQHQKHKKRYYKSICKEFHKQGSGRFYRIRYKSLDGLNVEGVVGFPKNFDSQKKYPVVLLNHGNWEEGGRFTSFI